MMPQTAKSLKRWQTKGVISVGRTVDRGYVCATSCDFWELFDL